MFKRAKIPRVSLSDTLTRLEKLAEENVEVEFKEIMGVLSYRGYAALLIFFGFPIVIPGLSVIFGSIVAWLGIRITFAKKPWWPKWVINKKVKGQQLLQFINKAKPVVMFVQKFLHPRLTFIIQSPFFYHFNGFLIFILGCIMALPLPIPLSNVLFASPVLCMGLAFLEDDGFMVLIAYLLVMINIFIMFGLFHLGARINGGS